MREHAESLIRGQPRHPQSSPPELGGEREEKARESLPLPYTAHAYTPPAAHPPPRRDHQPATLNPSPKLLTSASTPWGTNNPPSYFDYPYLLSTLEMAGPLQPLQGTGWS